MLVNRSFWSLASAIPSLGGDATLISQHLPANHPNLHQRHIIATGTPTRHTPRFITIRVPSLSSATRHPLLLSPESTPPEAPLETPTNTMEEAVLLHDALIVVRQQSALMKKCLETPGKLMDALKCRSGSDPPLPRTVDA